MPTTTSSAEDLAAPLLPKEDNASPGSPSAVTSPGDDDGDGQADHAVAVAVAGGGGDDNTRQQPQPQDETRAALPNEDELVEEGRVVVDSTPEATPSSGGCCSLVKEFFSLLNYLLHRPLFSDASPDNPLRVQVRFIKFLAVTCLGIVGTHWIVVSLDWEHRKALRLSDIWLYEGNLILLDCIVFFSVGRLYSQRLSVDHVLWMTIAFVSSMFTSLLPKFKFLQHSVTLFEMHCLWPWQLWVFVGAFVLPCCTVTVVCHLWHAYRNRDLPRKAIEIALTMFLLFLPQAGNPSFEFHHWFAGLVFGMHANYDTWFSRATMSWCWGQYMNGIAVWGRDPTLTCAYAQYISTRQGCTKHSGGEWGGDFEHSFLESDNCWAHMGAIQDDPPDWRHCPTNY